MTRMNFGKYPPAPVIELPDRRWPDRVITRAPRWCSVDLRDGNQALPNPMNVDEKKEMFALLVRIGFKEIEVGFPSSSDVEFRFLRSLIEEKLVPDDVSIQVLTPAREHLIRKTYEAVAGARNVIVHLYNPISTLQRRVVFRKNRDEVMEIAVEGALVMQDMATRSGDTGIRFEYSPESFTGAEPDYALEVCHAVMNVWRPTRAKKVILNLPATVELSTPNIYADRIEWFCRNVRDRESVIVSVHAHNDRGSAVAATELALMAGADRVEGTLFGNGERTGNADLVTLALNLFSQGIDPELDFTCINEVRDIFERTTHMRIHGRHPYAGELVYTAFSGSHQDAIHKGMAAQRAAGRESWEVPYLPIDPGDVGRSYEAIIRITSQSGKGGVAYVMAEKHGIHLPKGMHADFAAVVQGWTDRTGEEATPEIVHRLFMEEFLTIPAPYVEIEHCSTRDELSDVEGQGSTEVRGELRVGGRVVILSGRGNGPVDAFVAGLRSVIGVSICVMSYAEHALDTGADAKAVCYIGIRLEDEVRYGVGIDASITGASFKAVLSALNRAAKNGGAETAFQGRRRQS